MKSPKTPHAGGSQSSMLLLVFLTLVFACASISNAATNAVLFSLGDFTTSPVQFKQMKVAPMRSSFPRAEGDQVVGIDPIYKLTDSSGQSTLILSTGDYEVSFTNRFTVSVFKITTPSTNYSGTLNAKDLTSNGTNSPSNLNSYSMTQSDARYVARSLGYATNLSITATSTPSPSAGQVLTYGPNGVSVWSNAPAVGGISVAQGTNVILTTNGSVITINATGSGGGGSGDVTTSQLNTASNTLWLAPYAFSFPTGLVLYTHPRSGFYTDSSGTSAATNQGLIARWNDASGRGNHLTSTNTTARPRMIYEAGNPLAFFANGESQQSSNVLEFPPALIINSRAFSVFFVLQPMATLTNLGILQASNNNPGIIIEGNGDERGVVSLYGTSLVQSHIQTRASWSVLGVVGDTNMARIYHHGESTNLAAYASATASGGIIGRWVNQRPYYGKIASVLLFDRALQSQEAEGVVSKLQESFDLSTPNRNRLIVIGDSIVRGDTTSNGLSYAQQVAKRLGQEWEIINIGLGWQYLSTIKNHSTNTIVPLILPGRRNVVLIEAGSNDIKLGGASGEDTYTNLVSLAGTLTRAGAQVVVTDILPRQNDATFNTKRLAFNTLVTNNWATFAAGYAPFAADSTIGDSGDESNTTYYSDTIHPTEQGAGIMANYTAPVILSLPLTSSSGLATNANQFAASDTLTIKDGANLTNLNLRGVTTMTTGVISGALRMNDVAVVTDEIASTNWNFLATPNINTVVRMFDLTNGLASVSDYVDNNFQPLSTLLGNLAGNPRADYTNRFVAGSNISLTTNSGGVVTIAATGSGSQTPWASDIDGAGYSLTNLASIQINGTGSSQLLLGTQNTAGLTVEAPSTPSTNGWGVKFFASASVQEIAPGSYNDWQMTNNAGAALTLVFTNAWAGQFGSVKLPGAASGGSDYAVTVVQPLGEQVRFHFPTNGATTFTRTNGQDCQLEYWFTRLNTTNVLNCALGRAIQ